jgi:hypothetical protein
MTSSSLTCFLANCVHELPNLSHTIVMTQQLPSTHRSLQPHETAYAVDAGMNQVICIKCSSYRVRVFCISNPCSVKSTSLLVPQVERPEFVEVLSGNRLLPGSEPAAHCYCGYQFGYFSGQLGDGAAMYLGEVSRARALKPIVYNDNHQILNPTWGR